MAGSSLDYNRDKGERKVRQLAGAKMKIIYALEKLLWERSVDEIYVSDIGREAGIARKTFYRHYQDRYDLVDRYFEEYFQNAFKKIIFGESWEEALMMYLTICEEKAEVLICTYESKDGNGLYGGVEMTAETYRKYLIKRGADVDSADMQFAVRIADTGETKRIVKWLLGSMQMEKQELVHHMKHTLLIDILKFGQNDTDMTF